MFCSIRWSENDGAPVCPALRLSDLLVLPAAQWGAAIPLFGLPARFGPPVQAVDLRDDHGLGVLPLRRVDRQGTGCLFGMLQAHGDVSGSQAPLPKPSPLRTGHDDCPSSGSSLCRPVPDPHVVSMMAPPVYQLQVVDLV
jgi:hypothetical protein